MKTGNKVLDETLRVKERFYCLGIAYIIAYKIGEDLRGAVNFKEMFPDDTLRLAVKRIIQNGMEMETALQKYNDFYMDNAADNMADSMNNKGLSFYKIITEIIEANLDGASIEDIYQSIHNHLNQPEPEPPSEPFDFGRWLKGQGWKKWKRKGDGCIDPPQYWVYCHNESNIEFQLWESGEYFYGTSIGRDFQVKFETREEAEMFFKCCGRIYYRREVENG